MVDKKLDKRVRRTKRLVREALIELMADKPVERVTTTELCAKADINRNTFYAHYSSPEDVLAEIEEQLVADITALTAQGRAEKDLTPAVCRYVEANQALCRAIMHGCPRLVIRATDLFCERALALWGAEGLDDLDEGALFLRFAARGTFAVMEPWLDGGCRQPPEEIAATINRFVCEGGQRLFEGIGLSQGG